VSVAVVVASGEDTTDGDLEVVEYAGGRGGRGGDLETLFPLRERMDVGSMTTGFVSLDSAEVAAVLTLEADKAKLNRVPLEGEEERPTSIKSK